MDNATARSGPEQHLIKPIGDLLAELSALGLRLTPEDGALRIKGSIQAISPPLRAALLARKSEIIAYLSGPLPRIAARDDGVIKAPLSFNQRRLWFIDRLEAGSAAFNLPLAWLMTGSLDLHAFHEALAKIINRHPVLRSRIGEGPEGPEQWTVRDAPFSLCPEEAPENADPLELVQAEARRPFDLKEEIPFRIRLFSLSPQRFLLIAVFHHIVSDHWSMNIFIGELSRLYASAVGGAPEPLPELPVRFADYAAWQHRQMTGEWLEKDLAYWRARLAGAPAEIALPCDRPRQAVRGNGSGAHRFFVPVALVEPLLKFGLSERATAFMTFLALWTALLARTSGQDDFTVGCPVSSREREELQNLIGFFVNTVVLRCDLSGHPSLRELLARTRAVCLEAFAHGHVPFDRLVAALRPERALNRSPLFQTMFVLQTAEMNRPELPGLTVELLPGEPPSGEFDLNLSLELRRDGLYGHLEYDPELFDGETAQGLIGNYLALMEAARDEPDRPFTLLPLAGQDYTGIKGMEAGLTSLLIPELFSARAALAPAATALETPGRRLTYGELEAQANRLAHYLLCLGAGPEKIIGICLARSADLVVAMLAVLKANAAYCILDPAQPALRRATLVRDTGLMLMISGVDCLEKMPAGVPVFCPKRDRHELAQYPDALPSITFRPDYLAYICFTSGSTGKPKGVMVEQGNLLNHARAVGEEYGLCPGDRVLQFASAEFDVAAEEIYPTLLAGATLVIAPEETGASLEKFTAFVAEKRLTVLNLPAPFWHSWVECLKAEHLPPPACLRLLITGSDRVSRTGLDKWRALAGDRVQFINAYGLTETTITSTVWTAGRGLKSGGGRQVPVGRALAGMELHVVDPEGKPLPPGMAGEVVIAGKGVARGYLGRPDLTAQAFRPDARAGRPGKRTYWTGDRGRLLSDGTLELLGRSDDQVKIRGYRIEPGEIEEVLRDLPQVGEAAVIAVDDGGLTRLAAAVTAARRGNLTEEECRAWLQERLPLFMQPSLIRVFERLPWTRGGKIDRRALAALFASAGQPGDNAARNYAAARSPVEKILTAIWAEVLNKPGIGILDNFFELGGDSILSLKIASLAARQGLSLSLRQIFQHQSIAELAEVVAWAPPVAVAEASAGPVLLTPILAWFRQTITAAPHHYNQTLMLTAPDGIDTAALRAALKALQVRHDALRLRLREETGFLTIPPEEAMPLQEVDLSAILPEEREKRRGQILAETQASLDLVQGPVWRVVLLREGKPGSSRLLFILHHLTVDALSWGILLEDLQAAYEQAKYGGLPALPPSPVSFRDFAGRLQALSAEIDPCEELSYWTSALAGAAGLAEEENIPAAAEREGHCQKVCMALSSGETRALLKTAVAAFEARPDEIILAALLAGAQRTGRDEGLLVDLERHGRDVVADLDLSGTVGWFTHIRPVRLTGEGKTAPGELLRSVVTRVRAAPRGGIGYGLLRYLCPDAALRRKMEELPKPRILVNYLGSILQDGPSSSFTPCDEETGPWIGPDNHRDHSLEINAAVRNEGLWLEFSFTPRLRRESVEKLARAMTEAFREIGRAAEALAGKYGPADFPLAGLDGAALRVLAAEVKDIEDILPLSPLQEGMLFHSLEAEGDDPYYDRLELVLEGPLVPELFRRSWQRLTQRHQALRTSFHWQGLPGPLQVIQEEAALPMEFVDLSSLPDREVEQRLSELRTARRKGGFALHRAPLMHLCLVRTGERRWVLLHGAHHLLLDGWSLSLLLEELFALYQVETDGRPAPLPAPVPFSAFIAWQAAQDQEAAGRFWKDRMADLTHPTCLVQPGLRPPTKGEETPQHQGIHLGNAENAALQALAASCGVPMSTIIQAAWALLLKHYTGQGDVLFGLTLSGRSSDLRGAERIVGMLINTIPLRIKIRGALSLKAWLREIRDIFSACAPYAFYSLGKIVKDADREQDAGRFDTLLLIQNYPRPEGLAAGGVRLTEVRVRERTNYPLTMVCVPGPKLGLQIVFSPKELATDAVAGILGHLRNLLTAMAANPEQPVGSLTLFGPGEYDRIREASRGPREAVSVSSLPALVEHWARLSPDRIALETYEGEVLTYGVLAGAVRQMAALLQKKGTGPEVRVGVFLPRGKEAVVALLAVMKAGGCFVPLDPAYPRERLGFMVADCRAAIIVTRSELLERLPETGARPVCLDQEAFPREEEVRDVSLAPELAAYIIYTSGSTDRPKGTVNTHGGLNNLIHNQLGMFGLTARARILQFASLSFDMALWEIVMALGPGARLCLASAEQVQPGAPLLHCLHRLGITAASFTPTVLAALDAEELPELEMILVGGEACPPAVAARWGKGRRFYHGYGPTETSICTSAYLRQPEDWQMPIGRPMANLSAYVLDAEGELVPEGVTGELYLGGEGIGRGYHGSPGLTAEKFVPDPFGPPGSRLYKTGDLVYRKADGMLWFVSRADFQVKVRGFRIEPGEIERALNRYPDINASVVLVSEYGEGDRRLTAYLEAAKTLDPAALREYLAQILPAYMIPARFVVHRKLPRTPNGKIDRKALAAEATARTEGGRPPAPEPQNEAEGILCAIWADLLKLARVGRRDNFIYLGGDSILAIQAVARANAAGLPITLGQIMNPQTQTPAALAELAAPGQSPPVPLEEPVAGPVPCTPIQRWFFELEAPEAHHFNQTLLLTVPGNLDAQALESAAKAVARHHGALRMRFRNEQGAWEQEVAAADGRPCLLLFDYRHLAQGKAAVQLEREAERLQANLDLASGLLMKLAYFLLPAENQGRLLFIVHHLAVDAVSWQFLLEDLFSAYYRAVTKNAIVLPRNSASFAQFSRLLTAYAASPKALAELAYWRTLPEPTAFLPRKAGAPDRPAGVGEQRTIECFLDGPSTKALLADATRATASRADELLLAALAAAVFPVTGGNRLCVDREGHGRGIPFAEINLSRVVGWFTSLAPVSIPRTVGNNMQALLTDVRKAVRNRPHEGSGYGILRYLCPDESIRKELVGMTKAEILLNYLGNWEENWHPALPVSKAPEFTGNSFSPLTPVNYLLQVEAIVMDGKLRIEFRYAATALERSLVETVADAMLQALRQFIRPADGIADGIVLPLAPQQGAMLKHSIAAPQSEAYILQLAARLAPGLKKEIFINAWQRIAERHAIFRTVFQQLPGKHLGQCLRSQPPGPWRHGDWRGLGAAAIQERLAAYLSEDRREGFDLLRQPPLRFFLAPADDGWLFIWTIHHALLDGWSLPIVMGELESSYAAALRGIGGDARAPGFELFIHWLGEQDSAKAGTFWKEELRNCGLAWPAAGKKRLDAGLRFSESLHVLKAELREKLAGMSVTFGITLPTLLLGAWALTQAELSNSSKVLFGVTSALRPPALPGVEAIVGPLINTVPLAVELKPHRLVREWLQEIQRRRSAQIEHLHLPLADITEAAGRAPGEPLFGTIIRIQNYPQKSAKTDDAPLGMRIIQMVDNWHYPLSIEVAFDDEIIAAATRDVAVLEERQVKTIMDAFSQKIALIAEAGEKTLCPTMGNIPNIP